MTLVSLINGYGYPLIISDRAISEPSTSNRILLPTTNVESQAPIPVVDFNVKSVIIKDILCVAFAGNVATIENVYFQIVDFFMHRPVNLATLNELLETMSYDADCAVLFALGGPEFQDNKVLVARSGQWIEDDSKENLHIIATGSGANLWSKYLLENSSYLDESDVSITLCKQRILLTSMMFLNTERQTTANLRDGWGGGFDIVYYESGRFHRYNDVAYAFWVVDIVDIKRLTPVALLHNCYRDGNVTVRNLMAEDSRVYFIRQFGDRLGIPVTGLACSSKDVVTCIHIIDGQTHLHDLAVLYSDSNPDAEPVFYSTKKDGVFGIQFIESYIAKLREAVYSYLN